MCRIKKRSLWLLALFSFSTVFTFAQTTVTGKVIDSTTKQPLSGVSILIKNKIYGTATSQEGNFSLKVKTLPIQLVFSYVGHRLQEVTITDTSFLVVSLAEQTLPGMEVVVSASRIRESKLQSPVTIEKLNQYQLQASPSDNFYRALGNLKGIDMIQSSIGYPIFNARGFNSTSNTRIVQLLDGMDMQVPSLNLPAANLFGPSETDIESMEFLPGASSALYGPNAFNGIILQNTKDPFRYQGLSVYTKFGVNHIADANLDVNGKGRIGPGSAKPLYEMSLRYAKAFNNRFAFKVAASYSKATDWYGTNFNDRALRNKPAGFSFNPGADLVHGAGDEVSAPLGILKLQLAGNPAFNSGPLAPYLNLLPDHIVSRTPYEEFNFVNYKFYSFKLNTALHYRINDRLELSYMLNYGKAATNLNAAQRTPLEDISLQQHKIELKGDNFFVRAYTTQNDAGTAYSGDLTGVLINNTWKPHTKWFQDYAIGYLGYIAAESQQQGFDPNSIAAQEAAHHAARSAADVGRLLPGTPAFKAAREQVISQVIPRGSKIEDNSSVYHAEAQYDFKNQIRFISLQAGASYRLFDINSNGTLFADTASNNITVQEIGAYVQASKKIFQNKLKLTGSLRFDKNENFDAQVNPRIAAVFSPVPEHNFRLSFQTGFRNPTLQGQHVDFNAVSMRLLGGLPQYAEAHRVFENAFLLSSVQNYIAAVSKAASPAAIGNPANLDLLVPVKGLNPVKPETVRAYEIGYKTLLGKKLLIDVAYYYNQYEDFIAQQTMRKASGPIDLDATTVTQQNTVAGQSLLSAVVTPGKENTFSVYTNVDRQISAQGFVAGAEYSLPKNFTIEANYNWNQLNEDLGNGFLSNYNTPTHKFNVIFGNRKLTDKIGFNVAFRWQSAYLWESSFAKGEVPAFGLMDAQISYKLKKYKSQVKLGGSNIFNERYAPNYGAPAIGAVYYVSVLFDELMN